MAEISMVQMTGPAVSPGASVKEAQGGPAADFSELLREKGQSVSDSGKKTEAKRPEKEQGQTRKPGQKVTAQEDEEQEANEPASSLENTEEGLSVLAGMMLQVQEGDGVTAEVPEPVTDVSLTEAVLPVEESIEPAQMPERNQAAAEMQVALPEAPVTAQEAQAAVPEAQITAQEAQATVPETQAAVPETQITAPEEPEQAAAAVHPQDTARTRRAMASQEEPVGQRPSSGESAEQPQQAVQAAAPEQGLSRQENQAAQNQGESGAELLAEAETEAVVRPEEQMAVQGAAADQFRSQLPVEEGQIPAETGTVKTSEATMYRDIAETLATRMPLADGELTLELEPASLGRIIIKVAFEDGKTVMSLMADSHRTLAILSQRAGEMAQILEEKTGQQTVIYTPENQPSQEELPERGGEENRQRQRDAQEENRHGKESESFMQQLRLGLVG